MLQCVDRGRGLVLAISWQFSPDVRFDVAELAEVQARCAACLEECGPMYKWFPVDPVDVTPVKSSKTVAYTPLCIEAIRELSVLDQFMID